MAMSQRWPSVSTRGEVITAKKAHRHGNGQVSMAGQVTEEKTRGGGDAGVNTMMVLLTSMRAARPAMKARR